VESNKKIKGWVTYTCNDKFIEGVIFLKKSLVRVKSQYELYCMVTEFVTKEGRENLKINGIRLIDIEKIHIKRTEGIKDRYSENSWMMFSKFNLWRLTQFDSLVYLDADLIFIKNADELISQISLNENVSFAAGSKSNKKQLIDQVIHLAKVENFLEKYQLNYFPYIFNNKGESLVDYIAKYETLTDDYFKIIKHLGIDLNQSFNPVYPLFQKNKYHYKDIYDQESKTIVAKKFEEEIDAFQYTYD